MVLEHLSILFMLFDKVQALAFIKGHPAGRSKPSYLSTAGTLWQRATSSLRPPQICNHCDFFPFFASKSWPTCRFLHLSFKCIKATTTTTSITSGLPKNDFVACLHLNGPNKTIYEIQYPTIQTEHFPGDHFGFHRAIRTR